MGALKDLWESERGLVAIALIVASTVLCALATITPDQWLEQTRWLFITYASAKTVTGAVAMLRPQPVAAPVSVPTVTITPLPASPASTITNVS